MDSRDRAALTRTLQAIYREIGAMGDRVYGRVLPGGRLPARNGGTGTSQGAEPPLGNPASDGQVLSSTTAGARSWVDNGGPTLDHDHTSAAGDGGVLTNDEHDGYSEYAQIVTPTAPPSGTVRIWAAPNGHLYQKEHDGTVTQIDGTPPIGSIDDIGDVDAPAPASGDVLAFDGVNWVNTDPATIGAGGAATTRYLGAYNYRLTGAAATRIGLATSPDGRTFARSVEPLISLGAGGTFDDDHQAQPWLVQKDGVLYLYYSGFDGTHYGVGLARSWDGGATWTKEASAVLTATGSGWEASDVSIPVVVYDPTDTTAGKRWKMWYCGNLGIGGVGYAYSADGITWTKGGHNPVLAPTSGFEGYAVLAGAVARKGGTWSVIYAGLNANTTPYTHSLGLATATDPEGGTAYSRSASNPVLVGDGIGTTLGANVAIGNTTITVADATVFPIGAVVWVYNNTARYRSTVIDRPSTTTLTLADAAPVAVTSGSGKVRSASYNALTATGLRWEDGWLLGITGFHVDPAATTQRETAQLAYGPELDQLRIDHTAGAMLPLAVADSTDGTITQMENLQVLDLREAAGRQTGTHDASDIVSGRLAIARLASGTPDGTKFVRDDGTLAVPTASSITIREVDGSPSGAPTALKFPNGTLTDNGDGTYTYTPATPPAGSAWGNLVAVVSGTPEIVYTTTDVVMVETYR